MWIDLYLWVNAAAYIGLGLWCAVAVDKTSASLGFIDLNASGRCEYTAVYGGLQFGLGILFAFFAARASFHAIGIVFALAVYGGIVLFRIIGLIRFWPVAPATRAFAGLEVAMLLAAVLLYATNGAGLPPIVANCSGR